MTVNLFEDMFVEDVAGKFVLSDYGQQVAKMLRAAINDAVRTEVDTLTDHLDAYLAQELPAVHEAEGQGKDTMHPVVQHGWKPHRSMGNGVVYHHPDHPGHALEVHTRTKV